MYDFLVDKLKKNDQAKTINLNNDSKYNIIYNFSNYFCFSIKQFFNIT